MMKKALLISSLAVLGLAGCASEPPRVSSEPSYEIAAQDNFLSANRAALDALLTSINLDQFGGAPILVATLVNLNELNQSSAFGRSLSEQFGSRLVGRGFSVMELKLRDNLFVQEGTGELMLSREVKDIARSHSATMVLVGTYTTASSLVYVNIKLVRAEDGRILSAHDYPLPIDRNIRRLLQAAR